MTPDKKPKKIVNLANELTADELDKISSHQTSTEGAYIVDDAWLRLAEFGKAYGWEAYTAARDDKIPAGEMLTLIEANRKLEAMKQYQVAEAVLIGSGTVQAGKKATSFFRSMTKHIINKVKVQE